MAVLALAPVSLFAQFDQPGGGQAGQSQAALVDVYALFSISAAEAGQVYDATVVYDMAPEWHINSARPSQDWLIAAEVAIDTIDGITPTAVVYPAGEDRFLAGETMSVYSGRTLVPFRVAVATGVADGEYILPIKVTYQPCNDLECRAPATVSADLTIKVGPGGQAVNTEYFGTEESASTDQGGAADTVPAGEDNDLARLINEYGVWGYFLALGLAFLTGLLLSFSPCTYPMIPITVSIFAGQKRSVGRGFFLSLVYVVSMAVVYGIMGLIVSLVGGVFGAWLASTPVVIGITVVFVIFAMSMFGLYELQVPSALRQKLGGKAHGGGVVGSMILGLVAALVVSPCVGPFVAGILIYVAASGSPIVGFLVLFVFALGLGTLYLIIGTFSSAINALPGSGDWMETVKKFFGFVLLLMALYFLRTIVDASVIAILTGLLLVAFGVFGGGFDRLTSETTFFPRLKKFLGVLALLLGGYLLVGSLISQGMILPPASEWLPAASSTSTETKKDLIPWETDLEAGLARAARENKPVLIDTWATWCANCRVLDKKTFHKPEVAAEAEYFVPIKVQLENTGTPETQAFMKQFGMTRYSLPTTLLLAPDGSVRRILYGVVGPEVMIEEMRALR